MAPPAPARSRTANFSDVRSLFPEAVDGLSRLQRRNAAFRGLCEHYERAASTLRSLEIRNRHHDVEAMHLYRRLLRDLAAQLAEQVSGTFRDDSARS